MIRCAAILLCLSQFPSAGNAADTADTPFVLGVQTHFEQNWSLDLLEPAGALGATVLRDEIGWDTVERVRGVYDFTVPDRYMLPMLAQGFVPLIVINETNPLYDDDDTPHTAEGRAGFAAFVSAILSHYGPDALRIEIGNEVNSTDFTSGPALEDQPRNFAALVRAVDAKLVQDHPDVRFTCAGLNTIGIEFARAFFRRGGLVACDGFSVHPYRDHPETLPLELARLRAVMAEFGGAKTIDATEFGGWFDDPENAPDYMLRITAILAAQDVRSAIWYALRDEPYWPNMGLLTEDHAARKPASDTFVMLQEMLLPLGRPVSVGDDPTRHIYEFGNGQAYVLWGADAALIITGATRYLDSRGRPLAPVDRLDDRPVVVLGQGMTIDLPGAPYAADSLAQYGQSPWSYYARRPDIGLVPLEVIDSEWTSRRGAPDLSPLQIGDSWITTARFRSEPYMALERFTAPRRGDYQIAGWWQASEKTDAPLLSILHNGKPVFPETSITAQRYDLPALAVTLDQGDTLDFQIAPAEPAGTGALQRRIRITGPAVAR